MRECLSMIWDDFVFLLHACVRMVLAVWMVLLLGVVAGLLMAAPVFLISWLSSMVVGA